MSQIHTVQDTAPESKLVLLKGSNGYRIDLVQTDGGALSEAGIGGAWSDDGPGNSWEDSRSWFGNVAALARWNELFLPESPKDSTVQISAGRAPETGTANTSSAS